MNKLCCLIIIFITCITCEGQNLVPNGNFEGYSNCPTSYNQLDSVLSWFNPTASSPDYFNQCASSSTVGVPYNAFGYQPAYGGGAYAGIVLWAYAITNRREYIEVPLLSPLIANECYHFEMYINLPEIDQYTSDAIGAYFSDTLISDFSTQEVLSFIPQINNATGNIPDTLNWTLVSGNFTAIGNESYLIIGNFKSDANTNATLVNNSGLYTNAYVYVDDVLLSLCTSLEGQNNSIAIRIYPNPVTDKLNISIQNNESSEIIIYDISSKKLLQQTFANSTSLNTERLAKGIYLYEVRNKNGLIKKGKIVKD
jgi:hypothetical protein